MADLHLSQYLVPTSLLKGSSQSSAQPSTTSTERMLGVVCHQCRKEIEYTEIAHRDIYSDLCWIQCKECSREHGNICGIDERAATNRHGYFECPFIRSGVRVHQEPGQL